MLMVAFKVLMQRHQASHRIHGGGGHVIRVCYRIVHGLEQLLVPFTELLVCSRKMFDFQEKWFVEFSVSFVSRF